MNSERRLYLARVAGLAGAYYGSGKLGLDLAFETRSVSAIWPPTGIALAALVLWGTRLWPAVAAGAFLANVGTGVPLYAILGITIGNTLEALVGAYLLRRFGFRPSLERLRDVIALVLLAAALSTIVSASVGVASLLVADEIAAADVGSVWRTWWLGDMGGDLLMAPAVMIAFTHWPFGRAPGGPLEAVTLVAVLAAVSAVVFSSGGSLGYLIFPPLIWASLRFWQPGAAAASLLVAGVAISLAESNVGPFAGHSPDDRLLLAQTFVGVAGVTSLVLAAVTTERRRIEDAVERVAGTLQESLRPSSLPEVPGVETALDFRPAGERHLVGGDFYDLFENEDGSWDVVVGDVCGKGAAAAAVTGLARYTLRAAAIQEREPSRILRLLNGAILRQRSPGEFCTVAYGRLELNGAGGARVTFASGGHPLPLVLRADGTVEALGRYGTLLGVTRDPTLADCTVELAPRDALVLYTDGLTDAYAPSRIVTPAELVATLEPCAGRGAREIANEIRASLLDRLEVAPRDDIALLVLRVRDRDDAVEQAVAVRLKPDLDAIPAAREALHELERALEPDRFETLRLLVTELVTNSIRHADTPARTAIELKVEARSDRIRVEVGDQGSGFEPRARSADSERAAGWGLYLVEQLADRWGVIRGGGTRVWFELDR